MAPSEYIRKVLEEFIEIYRDNPCLWKVKSKEYHDKKKKDAAYQKLIDKLKEIEPNANKDAVARKINNLRSNIRKERKKYEKSLKSGGSETYTTKLWYYDSLSFLNDQIKPRKSSSNLDSDEDNSGGECSQTGQDSTSDDQENPNQSLHESTDNNEDQPSTSNSNPNKIMRAEKRTKLNNPYRPMRQSTVHRAENSLSHDILVCIRDHFKDPLTMPPRDDRFDIIGKNIAMKLRDLEWNQGLVAEKLINDLLFEAEMGNLTQDHTYLNIRDILNQFKTFNENLHNA